MTVAAWEEFKESEDYLWLMARVEGFRGANMAKLVKAGKKRRAEAWEVALDMAKSITKAEVEELELQLPEEQVQALTVKLAEKLMCEQNFTPPTFTEWAECETCGKVPVPQGTESKTPNCPWCMI
jgi:hypothetical protein